jgi:hypothetical protein
MMKIAVNVLIVDDLLLLLLSFLAKTRSRRVGRLKLSLERVVKVFSGAFKGKL